MNEKQFTISEVIDSFGITKHSWVLFIILSLAQVLDGYDFMIINSTNLFVAHTFWPNDPNPGALMGSLTTWGLLGMVIGGAFGGILSDKIGRKKVLIGAVAFYGVFTLPQAFASDLTMFAAFRLIAGLGVEAFCVRSEPERPDCPISGCTQISGEPARNRVVFISRRRLEGVVRPSLEKRKAALEHKARSAKSEFRASPLPPRSPLSS